ncbi:MAG: peptidase [Rhodobacteraceae bacterium]|nr:peptidase [Paracoccaceae bacterium]
MKSEERVTCAARDWIGTPYRHQCSVIGKGADCLGLIRGVWREVVGTEPEVVPAYSADWSEASGDERLWAAAVRCMEKTPVCPDRAGQVVLFRMYTRAVAKHVAILGGVTAGYPTIIHAYSGVGVVETPLTSAWQRRIVAQFKFPQRRS